MKNLLTEELRPPPIRVWDADGIPSQTPLTGEPSLGRDSGFKENQLRLTSLHPSRVLDWLLFSCRLEV